jgi:hypothetical protein
MPSKAGQKKRDPLRSLQNPSEVTKLVNRLPRRTRKPSAKAAETFEIDEDTDVEMDDCIEEKVLQGVAKLLAPLEEYLIGLVEDRQKDGAMIEELTGKIENLERQLEEQNAILIDTKGQLELSRSPQVAAPLSYAAAAASKPEGPSNGVGAGTQRAPAQRLSRATPSSLFCTVEARENTEMNKELLPQQVRAGIENVIRTEKKQPGWRCLAVLRDNRNPGRVRILCRDEEELQTVKKAAEQSKPEGGRVLRDQLYPVKMDSVAARAILKPDGSLREDARANLEEENDVKIAKIVWLSNRESRKAYGSMAVFFTKGEQAAEVLQSGFFIAGGESAYTSVFEARQSPTKCYNCQQFRHKAYSCKNEPTCAKCAAQGHGHRECTAEIFKCVSCGGPHEAYSKSCSRQRKRKLTSSSSPSQC